MLIDKISNTRTYHCRNINGAATSPTTRGSTYVPRYIGSGHVLHASYITRFDLSIILPTARTQYGTIIAGQKYSPYLLSRAHTPRTPHSEILNCVRLLGMSKVAGKLVGRTTVETPFVFVLLP